MEMLTAGLPVMFNITFGNKETMEEKGFLNQASAPETHLSKSRKLGAPRAPLCQRVAGNMGTLPNATLQWDLTNNCSLFESRMGRLEVPEARRDIRVQ